VAKGGAEARGIGGQGRATVRLWGEASVAGPKRWSCCGAQARDAGGRAERQLSCRVRASVVGAERRSPSDGGRGQGSISRRQRLEVERLCVDGF
jgi:hypothetical protein